MVETWGTGNAAAVVKRESRRHRERVSRSLKCVWSVKEVAGTGWSRENQDSRKSAGKVTLTLHSVWLEQTD
eukprot:12383561-Ditylum_brightwellii.AAC.1